ncbi:MAG TPA: glycosyltransferase [Gammaproteobacteria bacterium]|nr:glycosyltransferase [Gammaproteobacteria bacterium]
MQFRPCIIIPVYNHGRTAAATVAALSASGLPCFIIDDGSAEDTQRILQALAAEKPAVILHRLPQNQGKGGAVIAGMELALRQGYTHALQIDADGQHNTDDVAAFLESARRNPAALVAGQPVYDASAPRGRMIARRITHFWVGVEILSLNPPDTMCGFRVYPLQAVEPLLRGHRPRRRMDFDTDIMVRLIWSGTPVIRIATRVTYPEDGSSHFRYFTDNLLISRMHTRLFFGMLRRLPMLLLRKRRTSAEHKQHWSEIGEKGTVAGIKILFWIHHVMGEKILQAILFPVVLYFFLTARSSRTASLQFLNRAYAAGSPRLRTQPSLFNSFRHFLSFAQAALDKAASWRGDIKHEDIVFENKQELMRLIDERTGIVIIGSHLGNIELSRAVADSLSAPRVNALMFTEHAAKYNSVLRKLNPKLSDRVVHLEHISPETAISLKRKIDDGEIIVILGDRTAVHSENRFNRVEFLGAEAPFAQGPFILASLLDCPVYLMFCLKQGDKYYVHFERFAERMQLPRKSRERHLQHFIQNYAKRLEHYCLQEPFQWFNFYDFWRQKNRQTALTNLEESEHNAHAYRSE